MIRQADFSETSRVVTFFTRDFGRLSALAKGAKRLKGPFEAAIDLLSQCQIVFIRKSSNSLDLLTEAKLVQQFRPGRDGLIGLYGGYYVAELLSALTEEYDPHPDLFDETLSTLEALASDSNSNFAIIRFELSILREIGQLPPFDLCAVCQTPTTAPGRYAYWVNQGGLICPSCRKKNYDQSLIQAGTVAVLRKLSDGQSQTASRLAISAVQLRELRRITTSTICHVMGRRPKTLRYIESAAAS